MSGCGSNCNCGSNCKCGSGGGCGMHLDIETTATATIIIAGVTPAKTYSDGSEKNVGAEGGHTCKCGSNCTCDPCNC